MRSVQRADSAQQGLTALATGLHQKMRSCDGEVCLEILILLADGERRVGHLARMLEIDMSVVSTRLGIMKQRGLVMSRNAGGGRFYALSSLVKVVTRGWYRLVKIRAMGGGEIRLAIPLKLMRQLAARGKVVDAHAPAIPEMNEVDVPEVRHIDLEELSARVSREEHRRAREPASHASPKAAFTSCFIGAARRDQ